MRFYAAHQLVAPQGVVIGALCVFESEPRDISDEQVRALSSLADRVVDLLELELRPRRLSGTVAELETAQAELRRSNEQLAVFPGQVSHDLRTPLATVSMALRMIGEAIDAWEQPSVDAEVGWWVKWAIGGSDRMQCLIDDLLSFARLGGELNRLRVDLATVVDDVLIDLDVTSAGASVEVRDLPKVIGDPVQLRAVLQNLITNAAKYTPGGREGRAGRGGAPMLRRLAYPGVRSRAGNRGGRPRAGRRTAGATQWRG